MGGLCREEALVIAKTLIKDQAQTGIDPAEVFTKANNLLCESNGEGMFVTAFMGVLDIPTGEFTYVNAGHNLPLIKQGDKYEWLKARPGSTVTMPAAARTGGSAISGP